MAPRLVDVLVVGGGPAGCLAARAAARHGASVLLVEAKRRMGALPHCAEFVPKLLAREVEIDPRARVQSVAGMETVLAGEQLRTAGPGWILDRQVFDHALAAQAAAAGAEVFCACRFVGLEGQSVILKQGSERLEIKAGAVVAADGASSGLAQALGMPRPRLLVGVQYEVPLAAPLERTLVWLDREYEGGYAWLFPKGELANLGLGCAPGANPRAALNSLQARALKDGLIRPGILARSGGMIPMDGPLAEPMQGRMVFCGDAAGLTHPITGAGIPQAVGSGQEAGHAAAALAGGKEQAGQDYAHQLSRRYGRYLQRGQEARKLWDLRWQEEGFTELMQQTWPAFVAKSGRS